MILAEYIEPFALVPAPKGPKITYNVFISHIYIYILKGESQECHSVCTPVICFHHKAAPGSKKIPTIRSESTQKPEAALGSASQ